MVNGITKTIADVFSITKTVATALLASLTAFLWFSLNTVYTVLAHNQKIIDLF